MIFLAQNGVTVSCGRTRLQDPTSFREIFQYLSLLGGDAPFNRLLRKIKHSLFSFPRIINASDTYSGPQKLFKFMFRTGFLIVNCSITLEI